MSFLLKIKKPSSSERVLPLKITPYYLLSFTPAYKRAAVTIALTMIIALLKVLVTVMQPNS